MAIAAEVTVSLFRTDVDFKTSVSLEEISNVSVENVSSATRRLLLQRGHHFVNVLFVCLVVLKEFVLLLRLFEISSLGPWAKLLSALRVIPETFLSGEDHKMILSLLKNLKKSTWRKCFTLLCCQKDFQ